MKRFAHLMPRIAAWDNLGLAFHKAAAGKRSASAVARFAANLDDELHTLVRELAAGTWQPGAYQRFVVRDPKLRVIHAAPFRDRVVHHALMTVAGPCLERSAVHHSYACRVGRGNRAAVQHAAVCTRRHRYFLKLDVRRYFDSIQHSTLRDLLRRRFKDGALLATLDRVIGSFHTSAACGLPIGTLTSQYFANFYLDGLDHWVMETLRCPAYVRYMDDVVLWHDDESALADWHRQISAWLQAERGLELKGLAKPTACRDGLPFLGYRITPRGVMLSRASRQRFVRRVRENERAHEAGELTSGALQRRTDALLAFTDVAHCQTWRRRVLERIRRPTAPTASCAAAPGTTTPATAAQPTAIGTILATTGTTRACVWPQLTRAAAAPRLTRSADCHQAGNPTPGTGREASRSQPKVPGGESKAERGLSPHGPGGAETPALQPAVRSRAEAHDYLGPTPSSLP